jgi:putative transposase
MIVDYIDSHRERFGVEPVCAVLAEAGIQVAPSTYYARNKTQLTDVELGEAYMANQLRSLWQNNWGVYGARKLWHAARRAGHDLGRDQVARLMKIKHTGMVTDALRQALQVRRRGEHDWVATGLIHHSDAGSQ